MSLVLHVSYFGVKMLSVILAEKLVTVAVPGLVSGLVIARGMPTWSILMDMMVRSWHTDTTDHISCLPPSSWGPVWHLTNLVSTGSLRSHCTWLVKCLWCEAGMVSMAIREVVGIGRMDGRLLSHWYALPNAAFVFWPLNPTNLWLTSMHFPAACLCQPGRLLIWPQSTKIEAGQSWYPSLLNTECLE